MLPRPEREAPWVHCALLALWHCGTWGWAAEKCDGARWEWAPTWATCSWAVKSPCGVTAPELLK